MFGKFKINSAAARLIEEKLYEQVYLELSQNQRREGLWAKALANGECSEEKAKALYIKYRVQSIKDEIEISNALAEKKQPHVLAKKKPLEEQEQVKALAKIKKRKLPPKSCLPRQKRINLCEELLCSNGYVVKRSWEDGWIVKEPLGGIKHINSLVGLEQYAKSIEK